MKEHDFLMEYYEISEQDLLKYLITGNFFCTVAGSRTTIEKEIHRIKLLIGTEEGSLQDILRFVNFMSEYSLPRGKIISTRKSIEKCPRLAHILIFDGAMDYLNYQGRVKSPVEVIFLDRSDAHFADARDELMNRYYNRETGMDLFDVPPAPVEMIMFKE